MSQGTATPAIGAAAITPSDVGAVSARAIYVGGDGDVTVDMFNGDANVTFSGCVAGSLLPIKVTRVYATGTTATNLLALT